MAGLTIYGDSGSGNCLKIGYVATQLGIAFDWVEITVLEGATRTDRFLAINPAGQVPVVILEDGRVLAQSAAIMLYLAEGSALIPADRYDRAVMYQWMFWEQHSHETAIAVRRYKKHFLHMAEDAIDPALLIKGNAALAVMDQHLENHDFFAGDGLSLADIALVAYTRLAHEGGFDLAPFGKVVAWVARVEAALGL